MIDRISILTICDIAMSSSTVDQDQEVGLWKVTDFNQSRQTTFQSRQTTSS